MIVLISVMISIAALITFFVMASNPGSVVHLLRQQDEKLRLQNEILKAIFKQAGGKVSEVSHDAIEEAKKRAHSQI